MSWKLVRLNFGRNVAHFGEKGIGLEETNERVRSDTLFSAWLTAYAQLFRSTDVDDLIQKFKTNPPFRLSSTFIFQHIDGQIVDYLPRPLKFPINYPLQDDLRFTKSYKKLRYLPLKVWQRWYQGSGFTSEDGHELETGVVGKLAECGTFMYSDAYCFQKLPKIAVDRRTQATNLYHTGFVQYQSDENPSGLYFLVEFSDQEPELENAFFMVLEFLGDEGLGGERSSGAGRFIATTQPESELSDAWKQVITFPSRTHYSLISLFWRPSFSDELLADINASYELQARGGWISSTGYQGQQLRRKSVRMFSEGSVFTNNPIGQLADVTPDDPRPKPHRIYRSGIALSLPIKVYVE